MRTFLVTFLAVIVAQLVLLVLLIFGTTMLAGVLMMSARGGAAEVAEGSYLIQEIPSEFLEYAPARRLPLPKKITTHTAILESLEKARVDDRITGVVLKIKPTSAGWGKLQEIRDRVAQLRAEGKPVFAYADLVTNKSLYLAAACDSIFMPPAGWIWATGFMAERYYLKDLLDRIGFDFQVSQIREYKSAAEMIMRTEMSQEVRENAEWVLEDLYEEYVSSVAEGRGVGRQAVHDWLELAQLTTEEAREQGMIDGVLFWEELVDRLKDGQREFASIKGSDYAEVPRGQLGLRGDRIAVVHGQGMITAGKSGWVYPLGVSMGDETMVEALEQVLENDRIKGVLLRLDTPGGLSLASDRIGRMVARVAAEKPLVISMVDVSASGGYMVSYRCSTLVALPNSIVGSIGSISARGNLSRLMDKIGVTWDRVTIGPHATLFSPVTPMSPEEFARFEQVHWRGYQDWLEGVARHRGMSLEQIDNLARGRVFTGRQALGNGLIDDLGGFDEALALLKEQAGIPADEQVTFMHYPVRKEIWEEIAEGDWGAAFAQLLYVIGLRTETEERTASTLAFWQQWLEADDPLAVYWWRY